jgi:hypothetical protein
MSAPASIGFTNAMQRCPFHKKPALHQSALPQSAKIAEIVEEVQWYLQYVKFEIMQPEIFQ